MKKNDNEARYKEIDDFCDSLARLWKLDPSLRFGELIHDALEDNLLKAEDKYAIKAIERYFDPYETGNKKLGKLLQTLEK